MIEAMPFGRTGHLSGRLIFGAAGLGGATQDEADAVLGSLAAHGVNHLDTAASYGDAELKMAPWLNTHRGEVFLATKTGDRDGPSARASLERSLARLGVDKVDSIQLHNLVEPDEWETAFAPGGAVEALAQARDEGLADFIGVTGHGLRIAAMHQRSLERFDFDSVLFPYNPALLADSSYRSDVEALITTCRDRQVAAQVIKVFARRRFDRPPAEGERRLSWYEPLSEASAIEESLGFAWSTPELFAITTSDWRRLPTILDVADQPEDLSVADGLEFTRTYGAEPLFDGAALERI